MTCAISVSENNDYVQIRFHEPVTKQVFTECARKMGKKSRETKLNRYLLDMRDAPYRLGVTGTYEFAYEITEKSGVAHGSLHALVVDAEGADRTFNRFIETVFLNACQELRFFTDLPAAIRWLRK